MLLGAVPALPLPDGPGGGRTLPPVTVPPSPPGRVIYSRGKGYPRYVPGQPRELPRQASLRYLKLEAKRRLAAGEFPALHQAQLAIAREHGQPSWAALKGAIAARERPEGHAVTQLRWIAARFRDAGTPGWTPPGDAELREHFTDKFLASVPPERLIGRIVAVAAELRREPELVSANPFTASGRLAGHLVQAVTETSPPHRLIGVQMRPLGSRISDPRTAAPRVSTAGDVPGPAAEAAVRAIATLGLPGIALAGGAPGAAPDIWSAAAGQANLEHGEALRTDHAFPAYQITKLITAVTVLRLVADGRLGLDDPANRYLCAIRLADDTVTVRDLLSHTGGVADPDPANPVAARVPDLVTLTGPVLACTGQRGVFDYSSGGYAALGQLVADLTGRLYPDAATRLVLRPLGMKRSWFPVSWPDAGAVTPYEVTAGSSFRPARGAGVSVIAAAGGLWTTAPDLARFGLAWSSLLPRELAAEALRPHAARPVGAHSGLGWMVNEALGLAGHGGEGPGVNATLLVRLDGGSACAALANRAIVLDEAAVAVLRAARDDTAGDNTAAEEYTKAR